ncbi:MAG: helix-turn-helix transcriptional regulator [Firmicutes bacterium]|nr:helix-turn-helix transcriptional regulator [Bacillota bacterium]
MTKSPCVGERIRAQRLKMGMTQQDLAGDTFTKSFISQIEKNHARPSLRSLQIIASRLGKPIGYFLGEEYTPTTDPDKVDHLSMLAARLKQEGKLQDAINYYKEALALADQDDHLRRGRLYFWQGEAYRDLEQREEAIQMLEAARQELESEGEWEVLSYTYNGLGDLLLGLGKTDLAIPSFERALDIIQNHPELPPNIHTTTLTNLGIALAKGRQYERAEHQLLIALERSEADRTYYRYGDICMALGYIYFHQQVLRDAYGFTNRARHFYIAIQDEDLEIQCQINQGAIEGARGNFPRAELHLLEAAERAQALGQPQHQAHALEKLAEVYIEWAVKQPEKLEDAEEVLKKAAMLQTDTAGHGAINQLLGEVLFRKNRLHEAIEALTKAAGLIEGEPDHQSRLADIYSRLGEICQLQGDSKQATEFLQRSVNLFREMQSRTGPMQ